MKPSSERIHVGTATYLNNATGDTYELGFSYGDHETALGRAWDLVSVAAKMNGWNIHDINVKAAR